MNIGLYLTTISQHHTMILFFVEGGRNSPSTQPKAVGIVAVEPNLLFYYIRTIRVTWKKEVKFQIYTKI